MSFNDAVAILKKARLQFLIYTSPTHAIAKPRWRVLMPTSRDLPPAEREKLLGRVNGLLGGIFSTESFTLSQSYYFGSVNRNPAHRAEYYSGDYIDERNDLDAGAIGKIENEKINTLPTPPIVGDGVAFTLKSLKVRGISADVLHLIEHFTTPPDADDKLKAMNNGHRHFKAVAELRRYALSNEQIEQVYLLGQIAKAAAESPRGFKGYLARVIKAVDARAGLALGHFWSFGPMNQFFFVPSLTLWPVASVDARLRPLPVINSDGSRKLNKKDEQVYIPASKWLSQNRSVETMTWAPGQPSIIFNKAMSADGGLTDAPGFRCFNTYRAPPPPRGNVVDATRWVDLVKKLYPSDAEHIFDYAAHRVQKPGDKINHCLVLLGVPGIGKDTLIAAILRAVGTWNCTEASPQDFFEAFNPHVRAVIMRINEAHDLGDVSRYSFYERTKIYAASPPETLAVNDKNIRKYYIPNVCGIIITSNYRTECLYLPADDRRHYVAWSDVRKEDFKDEFWVEFWKWLNSGGDQHVAAWLAARDISKFDPKTPPHKTDAFWAIVNAGRPQEEAEIMDVIDALGNPDALTIQMIKDHIAPGPGNWMECPLSSWFTDPRNIKQYSRRMESCGYMQVGNEAAKDGYWKVGGKRMAVYAKKDMALREQLQAVNALCGKSEVGAGS